MLFCVLSSVEQHSFDHLSQTLGTFLYSRFRSICSFTFLLPLLLGHESWREAYLARSTSFGLR